jgi:phage terminase small subunit
LEDVRSADDAPASAKIFDLEAPTACRSGGYFEVHKASTWEPVLALTIANIDISFKNSKGKRPMTAKNVRAPAHLSPAMRGFYAEKSRQFHMESHHQRLLQLACEAFDRTQEARGILSDEGLIIAGREGSRPHPAVAIERDARTAFARLISQLGLDEEEQMDPHMRDALRSTRPGGWRGK